MRGFVFRKVAWAIVAALAAVGHVAAAGEITWNSKIKEALSQSTATGRPVFVDIWAVWCVPCKQMDETTYRDPAIVEAMNRFVPLKVDQDSSEMFCDRHRVEGLPLVLYLDGAGREVGRRIGLQTAAELLNSMGAVSDGYAAYLEAMQQPKEPAAAEAAAAYLVEAGNPRGAIDLLRHALKASKSSEPSARLNLRLAEARLAAGDAKAASIAFERLAESSADGEIRARALEGLLQAQRVRGHAEDAAATLRRLQEEFPELAARLVSDD